MHKIMVFSRFVLLLSYIFCKENVPKCSIHFAWKGILCELLGWMFISALYTWLTFRKQIFCDFSSWPTMNWFYELIVYGIFKLLIYSHLVTTYFLVLKENTLLWCSQPSILPVINITQKIFLFGSLVWKHSSAQISFCTDGLHSNYHTLKWKVFSIL